MVTSVLDGINGYCRYEQSIRDRTARQALPCFHAGWAIILDGTSRTTDTSRSRLSGLQHTAALHLSWMGSGITTSPVVA
ncbi:hypothetical protein [Pseudomonas phage PIP]|nr:hypothetical protein [Pseudomonas phage PIP]